MATSEATAAERAYLALRCGAPDMVARFRAARALEPGNADLILAEAEAEFIAGAAAPGANLAAVLVRNPGWAAGHRQLASIRLERGEGAAALRDLVAAIRAEPRNGALWNGYIGLLADSGEHHAAADAAAAARRAGFDDPALRLIEASHTGQAGDLVRAERLLAALPVDLPGRAPVDIRHAIRCGKIDAAAALLDRARAAVPFDTASWALTEIVWRAADDARADWLAGQPDLIGSSALDLDLAALTAMLRSLHHARAQPVGQSVRSGTQTRGRLFDRAEPEIATLVAVLQAAVDAHWRALPPADATHPLLRWRDTALCVQGGWSVRLGAGGHHGSHIHAGGMLSSACYIALPPLDAAAREGWLELGRPPDDLRLDLPPRATIAPEPGRLVLFPSYLYHGTRAFGAGERLTVAFDAIPQRTVAPSASPR